MTLTMRFTATLERGGGFTRPELSTDNVIGQPVGSVQFNEVCRRAAAWYPPKRMRVDSLPANVRLISRGALAVFEVVL